MALEGRIRRGAATPAACPPRIRRADARVAPPATGVDHLVALNDIVVARGSLARVCRLDVAIDDTHLATFIADGLVVSSPTGSTGYSFSAGGPILDPSSRNLVVTPIAAYLSAIRSVVVGPSQVVRCTVVDAFEALVSIDGREDLPLAVGDVVEVARARAADPPGRARRALVRSGTCSARRWRCCRRERGTAARADGQGPRPDRPAAADARRPGSTSSAARPAPARAC